MSAENVHIYLNQEFSPFLESNKLPALFPPHPSKTFLASSHFGWQGGYLLLWCNIIPSSFPQVRVPPWPLNLFGNESTLCSPFWASLKLCPAEKGQRNCPGRVCRRGCGWLCRPPRASSSAPAGCGIARAACSALSVKHCLGCPLESTKPENLLLAGSFFGQLTTTGLPCDFCKQNSYFDVG